MTKEFTFGEITMDNLDLACIYHFAMLQEIVETNDVLPLAENVDIIRQALIAGLGNTPSFGIFHNGQLIGISLYLYSPLITKVKAVHCVGSYIHPEFRGNDLYIKFHEWIWDELRILGVEKIYGAVNKESEKDKLVSKLKLDEETFLCKIL